TTKKKKKMTTQMFSVVNWNSNGIPAESSLTSKDLFTDVEATPVGTGYDLTTGEFTCPEKGSYGFGSVVVTSVGGTASSQTNLRLTLQLKQAPDTDFQDWNWDRISGLKDAGDAFSVSICGVIVDLEVGDKARILLQNGGDT